MAGDRRDAELRLDLSVDYTSGAGPVPPVVEAILSRDMSSRDMMPEAFEHGGPAVGLVTVLGFALAFLLSTVE